MFYYILYVPTFWPAFMMHIIKKYTNKQTKLFM